MGGVVNKPQEFPQDVILLAGLALSVLGLTNVFTIAGYLLEHWTTQSPIQLGIGVGLLSVIVGYGFAAGSGGRRLLVGLALLVSWGAFFHEGNLRLLGWGGLLVCIGLLISDGVQEERLGIRVHFLQSGMLMVLTVVGASTYGHFQTPLPITGVCSLWGWSGIVLSVGGFALWLVGLTYNNSPEGSV